MSESFELWVERVTKSPGLVTPIKPGELVKSSSGKPFGVINFAQVKKKLFLAEIGKKSDVYYYHFYPSTETNPTDFYEKMSDAFIDVFKNKDQVEADWVPEMNSWAVRVTGWGNSVWGDDLALKVINLLDTMLV